MNGEWLLGGVGGFAVLCILIGVVAALVKTKGDDIQEIASRMGAVLEKDLGLDGAADLCHKIAAGKLLAVRQAIRRLWEQYGSADKIDDLVARIVTKSFGKLARTQQHKVAIAQVTAAALPGMLDDKDTDDILYKVLTERILGRLLTPELRRDLATMGPFLAEYGSVQFANLATSLAISDDPEVLRSSARELVNVLRNRDQLDDELVKRAIKGIPRAVLADSRHWATLNDTLQACKPASMIAAEAKAAAATV
jgi:hypothetical protein